MNHILVATDGSAGADAAVDEALALAGGAEAELTIVSVFHPPSALLGEPLYAQSLRHGLSEARVAVERAVEKAEEQGVAAVGEVIEGEPAPEIARLAAERDADLIVVGSRGHGPLTSMIVGSVSTTLIRDARCPVVVVNDETARARVRNAAA